MNIYQVIAFAILTHFAAFAIPVFAIAHSIEPTGKGIMIHSINAIVTVACALVIYFSK